MINVVISRFHLQALPSFVEAPSDIEVREGGTVKLPCRAQGRPKVRIIWDRIGIQLNQQQQQNIDETPQSFEDDVQEELLAKAKIMSLRSKRDLTEQKFDDQNIWSQVTLSGREKRDKLKNSLGILEFKQIMRDNVQDALNTESRKKRQTVDDISDVNSDSDTDDISTLNISNSPDAIPVVFFSTQSPQEVSRLEVNDLGELILQDVTKKDQVRFLFKILVIRPFHTDT